MCDIDKDVCVRPTSHFCRTLCIIVFLGIIAFALAFQGVNLFNLMGAKNETAKNETEELEFMPYSVGVGIADMTGPIAEIAFMGHADVNQVGKGIHTRQFSRAFVIDNNTTRVVLVSAEIHVVGIALRREVIKNLEKVFGEGVYNLTNVFISATHTFSTPGGFLGDYLLDVSVLGFSNEVFYAYCNGITKSIVRAHTNVEPARMYYAQTRVWNAHINRSPNSYRRNPKVERARFEMDTDNHLSQLRIMKKDNVLMGVMNFFAINANNLDVTNRLVSTDNLGYAALAMERALNPGMSQHGTGKIVGAFFVGNAGDVSPNIRGARCVNNKQPCDRRWKRCDIGAYCQPQGPAESQRDSAKIIGSGIFEGAMRVLVAPDAIELSPGIIKGILSVAYQYLQPATEKTHKYVPETRGTNQSHPVNGCVPAFGMGYMIGGLDGRPQLSVRDNYLVGNPLLDAIRSGSLMNRTNTTDILCHQPKQIWIATGRAEFPVPWHQVSSVIVMNFGGEVFVAGVPGEPSTMAGRRIRQVIKTVTGKNIDRIVIMGLTNEYVHHIATNEEYAVQAYEGGATIYGPNTLDIFLNKYTELSKVAVIDNGRMTEPGPEPSYFKDQAVSLIQPAHYDKRYTYSWQDFFSKVFYGTRSWGYVIEEPPLSSPTERTIQAKMMAGNPRNDLRHERTHMTVDRWLGETNDWELVATDADWDTRMEWYDNYDQGTSYVILYWDIPASARYSYYRLHYYGTAREDITAHSVEFEAATRTFYVSYKYTH